MIALAPVRHVELPQPERSELLAVVSASRLNCFHTCRLKFYFRYVLKLIKPATAALFVGKAVHAALQQWSVARWRGDPYDASTLKPAFEAHWCSASRKSRGIGGV